MQWGPDGRDDDRIRLTRLEADVRELRSLILKLEAELEELRNEGRGTNR